MSCVLSLLSTLQRNLYLKVGLGNLHCAEGTYLHDVADMHRVLQETPWRAGKLDGVAQEIFFGGGVHPVDLLRWIVGEVEEVFAYANTSGNLPEFPLPDQVFALMKFLNGAIGKVQVNIGIKGGWGVSLTICGSKGTIKVENGIWETYIDDDLTGRPILLPQRVEKSKEWAKEEKQEKIMT